MLGTNFRAYALLAALSSGDMVEAGTLYFPKMRISKRTDSFFFDEERAAASSFDHRSKSAPEFLSERRSTFSSPFGILSSEKASISDPFESRRPKPSAGAPDARRTPSDPVVFQYSDEWIKNGYALGGDLPLVSRPLEPMKGMEIFQCIRDAMPAASFEPLFDYVFADAESGIPPDAGRLERLAVFASSRPHRFGGLVLQRKGVEAGYTMKSLSFARELGQAVYALHSYERGRLAPDVAGILLRGSPMPGSRRKLVLMDQKKEIVASVREVDDEVDSALWEAVALQLMRRCGVSVVDWNLASNMGVKVLAADRFDRIEGKKAVVLSASALLLDRDSPRRAPAGYLHIADLIRREGSRPTEDLRQAWLRMAFHFACGGRSDDPSRWFFMREPYGWRLAPVHHAQILPPQLAQTRLPMTLDGRRTLKSEADLIMCAKYFGLSSKQAKELFSQVLFSTSQWENCAVEMGADTDEVEAMRMSFEF